MCGQQLMMQTCETSDSTLRWQLWVPPGCGVNTVIFKTVLLTLAHVSGAHVVLNADPPGSLSMQTSVPAPTAPSDHKPT